MASGSALLSSLIYESGVDDDHYDLDKETEGQEHGAESIERIECFRSPALSARGLASIGTNLRSAFAIPVLEFEKRIAERILWHEK